MYETCLAYYGIRRSSSTIRRLMIRPVVVTAGVEPTTATIAKLVGQECNEVG
jgi:hypothetical protein